MIERECHDVKHERKKTELRVVREIRVAREWVKPPRQTRGLIPIGETSHETSKRSYRNGWSQRSKSRTSRFYCI